MQATRRVSFAERLSVWQKKGNGIEPTGVLESGTWSRIVSTFQSRRLSSGTYTTPNQVITIPISDCYDPTRAEELRKVEPKPFAAYKTDGRCCDCRQIAWTAWRRGRSAGFRGAVLKIISAFRSREYQDQLRRQSPTAGARGLRLIAAHIRARA